MRVHSNLIQTKLISSCVVQVRQEDPNVLVGLTVHSAEMAKFPDGTHSAMVEALGSFSTGQNWLLLSDQLGVESSSCRYAALLQRRCLGWKVPYQILLVISIMLLDHILQS